MLASLEDNAVDIEYFLGGLRNRFEKDAQRLISNANVDTYDQLKTLLNNTYKQEKTVAEVNQAFHNCRQKPN